MYIHSVAMGEFPKWLTSRNLRKFKKILNLKTRNANFFSNFEHNINGHFLTQRCWIIMKIVSPNGHGCHFCRPPLISDIFGKFDLGLSIFRFLHANLYYLFFTYFW